MTDILIYRPIAYAEAIIMRTAILVAVATALPVSAVAAQSSTGIKGAFGYDLGSTFSDTSGFRSRPVPTERTQMWYRTTTGFFTELFVEVDHRSIIESVMATRQYPAVANQTAEQRCIAGMEDLIATLQLRYPHLSYERRRPWVANFQEPVTGRRIYIDCMPVDTARTIDRLSITYSVGVGESDGSRSDFAVRRAESAEQRQIEAEARRQSQQERLERQGLRPDDL